MVQSLWRASGPYITGMIVTYRHRPKRKAKPAQAATIKGPSIVEAPAKRRAPIDPPFDPEADARVAAFLARMIKPPERRECGMLPWRWPAGPWSQVSLLLGIGTKRALLSSLQKQAVDLAEASHQQMAHGWEVPWVLSTNPADSTK
jgi:hypothetical protein